jgi:hypothetical protein
MENKGEIVIYQSKENGISLNVRLEEENVWLSLDQLADLFDRDKSSVSRHIKNIFEEGELERNSTVANFATVQFECGREVKRDIEYYNLDMIISVGYRIKSRIATNFRIWATNRLKEYIKKGFILDDERLKNLGGGDYWHELLDRIRDIRSSEKVFYRQILDLYATSIDYNPKAEETIAFFKIVQNKFHYAVHGHPAAELIYERTDSDKPFMGLTSFKGDLPNKREAINAKNYLTEEELKILNNMVSGYFDFAEVQAIKKIPMCMEDYLKHLDNILSATGQPVLQNAGKISHEQAEKKALNEYSKYQEKTPTPVEKAYLETIKKTEKKIKDLNTKTQRSLGDKKKKT